VSTVRAESKSQGLKINPLRSQIALDPGNTTVGILSLTNESDKVITVQLSSENFGVTNENYDYKFMREESASWVHFIDDKVELRPEEKKQISYSLAIPANATPGGYDIALLATIEQAQSTSVVTEYRRVASLIYLDINGETEKKGSLLAFDIPWFSASNSVPYQMRIANQGNSHLGFDVRLSAGSLIGSSQVQEPAKALTLPRSVRTITGDLILPHPGIYKVKASYTPPQGRTTVKEGRVIYLPPATAILLLIGGGGCLYVATNLIRNRKKPITTEVAEKQ
jgi:hypothetical protein